MMQIENISNAVEEEPVVSSIPMIESHKKTKGISNLKYLKDILAEPDDSSSSVDDVFPSETNAMECISRSYSTSFSDTNLSALRLRKTDQSTLLDDYIDEEEHHSIGSISLQNYRFPTQKNNPKSLRMRKSSSCHITLPEDESFLIEKEISKLCFTGDEDYSVEMKTIYEILSSKSGLKYSLLKDVILDQLLVAISTSSEESVVRTSMAILSTIVTANRSVIEDIKRKGLQLYDLATALRRNVHEAVILIYLINPSPLEIKTLELLPCLVEVVCSSYKVDLTPIFLTPPAASLMIIEVLVTSFDYETNSMHLAAISSPRVLSGLLQVPRKDNLEEFISLAAVLVNCMRFDGKCRKYISEFSPVGPFVSLLCSNEKRAASIALEFFNELHRIPRYVYCIEICMFIFFVSSVVYEIHRSIALGHRVSVCLSRYESKEASTICVLYSCSSRTLNLSTEFLQLICYFS